MNPGWVAWALLSCAHAWAGWCWSSKHLADSSSQFERVTAAMVFAVAGLVGVELACGAFSVFSPRWLTALSLVWFGISVFATRRAEPGRGLLEALSRTVQMFRERASALQLALPLAFIALLASFLLTLWFRAWNYDGTVYHTPIAYLIVHHGSLTWPEFRNVWIDSYPFDVSLLSAWNIVFTREKTLDDAAQLPFVVLAMFAIASWARFAGASRATSASLGASFILLTPVWLQSMHTQVDIACAALLLAATRMLVGPATKGRVLVVGCALGLYVGTKFTGVLHFVALLPWIAWWSRRLLGWSALRIAALISLLGIHRYVVNLLVHGSPFWPFGMKVPLLGTLPGPIDPGPINSAASGSSGSFFSAPMSFGYMTWSWFHDAAMLWPDVRYGGFGPVFRWLLISCLGLLVLDVVLRRANARRAFPVLLVFAAALIVPVPWWPRYTLAAGAMGLVALTFAITTRRSEQLVGSLFIALIFVGWFDAVRTLDRDARDYGWPTQLTSMMNAPDERERAQITDWLWETRFIDARDAQYGDGGVILYDESADFLSEYFAKGLNNTPRFVSSADATSFIRTIDETNACWVVLQDRSPTQPALTARGMYPLFSLPRTSSRVWRTNRCP